MISVDVMRSYCGVESADDQADDILTLLEESAVDLFGQETGRYWGPVQVGHVYLLDGYGSERVWIPDWGVTSVSAVTYRGNLLSEWSTMASDAYAFDVLGANLTRVDGAFWPLGHGIVQATATRGFAEDSLSVPPMVRQAILDYVSFMYRPGRQANLGGAAKANIDAVPNWRRAVELYRLPLY